MKAMILAAGLGNRMRPLTNHTPKPLLQAGGKPLIEYHLLNLQRAGIREVVINLAHLGEKLRDYLGNGSAFGVDIRYSPEPEPLETGGAILHASQLLGAEPFLLVNGDVWCDIEFSTFTSPKRTFRDSKGHLLLVPNPNFHPQGDFALGNDGVLQADPEKTAPHRFTFSGISLLHPNLVYQYPQKRTKFPLVEILRSAIAAGELTGEVYRGDWCDVGTPERLAELDSRLNRYGRTLTPNT